MSDAFEFECEPRKRSGTGGSRAVRRDGWVPAIIYGGDEEPMNIKMKYNEVLKAYNTGNLIDVMSIVKLEGKDQRVIGRDIQVDPIKDLPMHVDLMRVNAKTRVTVNVPVRFLNEETCPGLKEGGVLNVVRHDVEVVAPATEIPEALEFDLSAKELSDTINISDTSLPKGVEVTITDRDFTIATIAAPSGLKSQEAEDDDEEVAPDEVPATEVKDDDAE
ncbi:50S ribosomal protein L25/general stress protein Ctc [Parvularcula sp. ZS-1/3]|uniref:Large ribosomal subunit protein bL25 n=1 Tax=Parvularcula mediterranea TaxID=2732508 RepID=A0A7Y3RLT5_9PROT|nr:50S ribosomal protein L25/general stress protein Ctc [Parvularcula mediterranea]NNU16439.1 50S ribosomal protein L25/general stress protein Ctc [Parvularcula mediterranea]